MVNKASTVLALSFVGAFFAVGIPYWQIPYSHASLPNSIWGLGLIVVAALAALSRAIAATRLWPTTFIIGASVPAAILVRVIYDTSADPTSHNLWPFELILSAGPGVLASVMGALVGGLLVAFWLPAVAPNNSFKPNPLRGIACVPALRLHASAATARVGLTQVLGVLIGECRMPAKRQPATFFSPILVAEGKEFSFAKVPPELSKSHLRRGRITARISVGKSSFDAQMEPDGKLGHWFIVPSSFVKKEKLAIREQSSFTLTSLDEQPDPSPPKSFKVLLSKSPAAQATWDSVTTLAKIDWIHWMESAKQDTTKRERAANAIDMLEKGKKRVCCFDPSGFYSKALVCPIEENE